MREIYIEREESERGRGRESVRERNLENSLTAEVHRSLHNM